MSTQKFIFSNPSPDATPIVPAKKKRNGTGDHPMLFKVKKYQKITMKQLVYIVIAFGKRVHHKIWKHILLMIVLKYQLIQDKFS